MCREHGIVMPRKQTCIRRTSPVCTLPCKAIGLLEKSLIWCLYFSRKSVQFFNFGFNHVKNPMKKEHFFALLLGFWGGSTLWTCQDQIWYYVDNYISLVKRWQNCRKNNTTAIIFDQTLPEDPVVLSLNGFNHNYWLPFRTVFMRQFMTILFCTKSFAAETVTHHDVLKTRLDMTLVIYGEARTTC